MSHPRSRWILIAAAALAGAIALAGATPANADEGMWTLDNLPLESLQKIYGFTPPAGWVDHVQKGCVRFNDGGSGSFVSPHGLVITNHHVAIGQLQKMSSAEHDYVHAGFYAHSQADEIRCPDLELNQLLSMENVTARVLGAIQPKAPAAEQNQQRKAEIARITKESTDATGLRSDVVELYHGAEYWLYRYKKYTDVRLVMAPEEAAANFGGDPDNFTYPRFALDFAFFRVYDNDQPVQSNDYFHWSPAGAADSELVFVAGHPGSTSRTRTVSDLEFERDHTLPAMLASLERRKVAYAQYAARGPEQSRRALDRILAIENSTKSLRGRLAGLQDPQVMAGKVAQEKELRALVAKDPKVAKECGDAWDRIAAVHKQALPRWKQQMYRGGGRTSRLATLATSIVRYTTEVEKPNEKRLEEYRDSGLESLRFRLLSPAPIFADLEETMLASMLQEARDELGPDDAYVKAALGGRPAADVAKELVGGTKLADVAVRKQLIEGGRTAVEASQDPFIVWARRIDPTYREMRTWFDDNVQSVTELENAKIARARFAVYGKRTYPDATFTLRLSYGKVCGYELGTSRVPSKVTYFGLYDRANGFNNQKPYKLAPLLEQHRGDIDLDTPLDFVSTDDIIGGNSGSRVLNRNAEFVGIVFDSNIQGLVLDYVYTETQARAVSVHSAAILEALRKVYAMPELVGELTAAVTP